MFGFLFNLRKTRLFELYSPGEKHPEVQSEKVWEAILKKLFQNYFYQHQVTI